MAQILTMASWAQDAADGVEFSRETFGKIARNLQAAAEVLSAQDARLREALQDAESALRNLGEHGHAGDCRAALDAS